QVPLGEPISRSDSILFSESNTRCLVEVAPALCEAFETALDGFPATRIGELIGDPGFEIYGAGEREGQIIVSASIFDLKASWPAPFKDW
ncbi:MAG: hypothetical protein Q7O66_03515, partial [Dehalococcoidia bacterium]|nr:hypothetical protein [Dehalococcoidia bacterium]